MKKEMLQTIPLRDAIRALRVEIMEAADEASTETLRFELGPIELEFHVIAKKEKGAEAKFGFHIFAAEATVGGSGKGADERTQKVKIVLSPIRIETSGERSKVDVGRGPKSELKRTTKSTLGRQ